MCCSDYAPAPELDYYDSGILAADDDPELHESYEKRVQDRLAAEEALDALDARRRERELQTEQNLERINRFEQQELDVDDEQEEEEGEEDERMLNLEAFECPLLEWISEERTCNEIARRFKKFLMTYYPGIEEVTDWVKRNEHINPLPPLPSHLRRLPPTYPSKIRCE